MRQQNTDVSVSARKELMAGVIVGMGTLVVLAGWVIQGLSSPQTGWDFPVFYIAGKLPSARLYDNAAFASIWKHDLSPLGVLHWAPYVRPAAFAPMLDPLASLPYHQALWLWMGMTTGAYFLSVLLLVRQLHCPAFLVPACAAYFPAIAGIISGQDAAFYLLAVVSAIMLLERGSDVLAGAVLVVCLCKFNLIVLVPGALILQRRFKALLSFSLGASCIGAISLYLTPLPTYLSAIKRAQEDTAGFYPVGLKGFCDAIGQPWCFPVLAAFALIACCWLMFRLPLMGAMCAAITGTLLISPYITWYDSTLLVLPLAVIFARENPILRWSSIAIIAAIPLWRYGGGNNGPEGFMHLSVELLIIGYLASQAAGVPASPVPRPIREQS